MPRARNLNARKKSNSTQGKSAATSLSCRRTLLWSTFTSDREGKIKFHGFWRTYEKVPVPARRNRDVAVNFAFRQPTLDGIPEKNIGATSDWKLALQKFSQVEKLVQNGYENVPMDLWDFYQKFLRDALRQEFLNVMDERSRFKSLGDHLYESGYWWRPERGCSVIRLFGEDRGPSFLGGEIIGERTESRGGKDIKIFTFIDDPKQHGKRRPDHFRANGCVASF